MSNLPPRRANREWLLALKSPWVWGVLGIFVATTGCALPPVTPTTAEPITETISAELPIAHHLQLGQLSIHSDRELPPSHRLLQELLKLRQDLLAPLGLPPSEETIHVYLFESPERFRSYSATLAHPISHRRAYFIQTDTSLSVYAAWSDQVATDLRHELTHAYLHSVVPRLPLWLDEGLAENFEVAPGQMQWNAVHLKTLSKTPPISLRELEKRHDPAAMSQHDYASSWAWVHFLLHDSEMSRAELQQQLAHWKQDSEAPRLSQLAQQKEWDLAALQSHLASSGQ